MVYPDPRKNIVDNIKLNEKIYLTPINGINLF